jgi:hypothetical protein
MTFHYIENLVAVEAHQGNPWEFKCTEVLTDEIRKNKIARQTWYNNPATKHSFYSGIEPLNPNARLNRENNPPHAIRAIPVDYDTLNLPIERILEAIRLMPIKPSRVEQSLGGNWRLVFTFSRPILVNGNHDFCVFLLKRIKSWLHLDCLPALDEGALETPTRYYCNGCAWIDTKHGDVAESEVAAFAVEAARDFNKFEAPFTDREIPLDVIETALREKFPNFNWPGPFVHNSQGPSFFIPGSTSPMSAILKSGGFYTFSAHADENFKTWSKLLGPEFSQQWSNEAITKATSDVYHDGHDFYMLGIEKNFRSATKDELQNYLKVNCRMSAKADKQTGTSQVDLAMNHIYRQNRIVSAGSFVFQKPGLIIVNGDRRLNTFSKKPMEPVDRKVTWGDAPFIYKLWRHMFKTDEQFWHFIAWLKHFYVSAFTWTPTKGQNIFMAGVKNSGKTLTNCFMIPPLVGGGMGAEEYILGESQFNAHLFDVPYWTIDDETVIGTPANSSRTANMFKKIAANRRMVAHAKFLKQSLVDWYGRLGVTLNLDTNSMRIIGPQDDATLEKTSIFSCNPEPFDWPLPAEITRIISIELPILARILLDVEIPDFVKRYNRYGYVAYHDPILLEQTNQSQATAPFKEMWIDALLGFWRANTAAQIWKGTVTHVIRTLSANPMNEHAMRGIKMDQVNRYLEQIQKEGLLRCEASSGYLNTRLWTFYRKDFEPMLKDLPADAPSMPIQTSTETPTKNPFEK